MDLYHSMLCKPGLGVQAAFCHISHKNYSKALTFFFLFLFLAVSSAANY